MLKFKSTHEIFEVRADGRTIRQGMPITRTPILGVYAYRRVCENNLMRTSPLQWRCSGKYSFQMPNVLGPMSS